MIRDFRISRGILTFLKDAPYSSKSTYARRLVPCGGTYGKPLLVLFLRGLVWKWFGK